MKKTVSYLFVVLILFNAMGYYGLFLGLLYTNDLRAEKRLATGELGNTQAVTIKIPITVPYAIYSSDGEYEEVRGVFEHDGEFYRLVKQRLFEDTLYVICFKDEKRATINKAFEEYAQSFSDQAPDFGRKLKTLPGSFKDFLSRPFTIAVESTGWEQCLSRHPHEVLPVSDYHPSVNQPPEYI